MGNKLFIEQLKLDLRKLIDSYDEKYYFDINFYSISNISIGVDNINIKIDNSGEKGIKIRFWDGNQFVEGSTTSLDYESIRELFEDLLKQTKVQSESYGSSIDLLFDKGCVEKDFIPEQNDDINYEEVLKDRTEKLKEIRSKILKIDNSIVSCRVMHAIKSEEFLFGNKYKMLYQKIPLNYLVVAVFVKCDDEVIRMVFDSAVDNGYEVFNKFEKIYEKFNKDVFNIKKAKKLKGGKYKVVLSPKLTGLLAHESFGHGMEADTIMKDRALAKDWIGKKIADDSVNIVDYPAIRGKHGEFYFDSDGNFAKKVYLVKNGVIMEPIADLYSKSVLGLEKSSNSRFESFDHKNYARMSNTYFEAGDRNYEDLISEVDDGILITGSSGGMEDPKGWGVQIQGCFGQRIVGGKLVDEFYDGFTITGFLPDIIKNISGISKEFEIEGGGRCGKGHKEFVRVSEGGPYLLINEIVLG